MLLYQRWHTLSCPLTPDLMKCMCLTLILHVRKKNYHVVNPRINIGKVVKLCTSKDGFSSFRAIVMPACCPISYTSISIIVGEGSMMLVYGYQSNVRKAISSGT